MQLARILDNNLKDEFFRIDLCSNVEQMKNEIIKFHLSSQNSLLIEIIQTL